MQLSLRLRRNLKEWVIFFRLCLAGFFLFSGLSVFAQAQLGFHLQQHAGINGVALNPARSAVYPYRWDINLVGFNIFVANDYGYLEQTSLLRLLQDPPDESRLYLRSEISEATKLPANSYVADFYELRRKGYGVLSTDIMGPSFSFKINEMHTVGLFTRARVWAGTQNVPKELSYYNFYNTPFFQDIALTPFQVSALVWSEVGLHYSLRVPAGDGSISFGVSLKSLNGHEGFYFQNEKQFNIVKVADDAISGQDYALSGAIANANLQSADYQTQSQGRGAGLDLGFLYSIEDDDGNHVWQFGFSILDLGRISFAGDSEQHRVASAQPATLSAPDYSDINSLADIPGKIQLFSTQTLGSPTASLQGNNFSIWLPTAISLQADHHFGEGWYAGAVLIQGVPINKQAPNRGSLLAVAPRIEKRWYAFSLPVSVYNWDLMRVGLAARLGPLVLGTDDLGSWLIRKNFSSGDIYAAIKVPFVGSSSGSGGGSVRGGRSKRGKNMGCYTF